MMLKLMDGSYVNTAHVSRFFVTEDFTLRRFVINVSISGPQMPFTVSTFNDDKSAHEALDQLVYRVVNEALAVGLYSTVWLPQVLTAICIQVSALAPTPRIQA